MRKLLQSDLAPVIAGGEHRDTNAAGSGMARGGMARPCTNSAAGSLPRRNGVLCGFVFSVALAESPSRFASLRSPPLQ